MCCLPRFLHEYRGKFSTAPVESALMHRLLNVSLRPIANKMTGLFKANNQGVLFQVMGLAPIDLLTARQGRLIGVPVGSQRTTSRFSVKDRSSFELQIHRGHHSDELSIILSYDISSLIISSTLSPLIIIIIRIFI